jgi:hypothetical protein
VNLGSDPNSPATFSPRRRPTSLTPPGTASCSSSPGWHSTPTSSVAHAASPVRGAPQPAKPGQLPWRPWSAKAEAANFAQASGCGPTEGQRAQPQSPPRQRPLPSSGATDGSKTTRPSAPRSDSGNPANRTTCRTAPRIRSPAGGSSSAKPSGGEPASSTTGPRHLWI